LARSMRQISCPRAMVFQLWCRLDLSSALAHRCHFGNEASCQWAPCCRFRMWVRGLMAQSLLVDRQRLFAHPEGRSLRPTTRHRPRQCLPKSAAARMVSTGSPVRPCRASVAFSTTVGLSFVSITLAPFQSNTTQPRGVHSSDSYSFPGTFCHLNCLEKKEK